LFNIVSIPHRYAENKEVNIFNGLLYEFQFLIGTLKTYTSCFPASTLALFQFLIGTLKTKMKGEFGVGLKIVSIPHR